MDNYYLTKEDINKNVLVSDFLISTGSTFFSQDNNTRKFLMFPDGRDNPYLIAFVNMDRNEWVCTNPEMGGKVTDLAEKVFSLPIDAKFMANALRVVQIMDDMPRPSAFKLDPSDKVQVPVDVGVIDEDKILIPLFCMGISKKVAYDYLRQGTYKGIKDGKEHHMLLFPNSNGGYYSLAGNGWRVVGEEGISLIGPKMDTQRLCVFDNPLDFLTLQQKRSSIGMEMFFNNDRYLIINGDKNFEDALGHIATHQNYHSVCYFFPITDKGIENYWKIHDICPEKIVNSSRLYTGFDTYADSLDFDIRHRRHEGFFLMDSKVKAAEERQKREAQTQAAKMQTSVRDVPQTDIAKANAVQKSVGVKKPQEVAPDDNSRKPTFRL